MSWEINSNWSALSAPSIFRVSPVFPGEEILELEKGSWKATWSIQAKETNRGITQPPIYLAAAQTKGDLKECSGDVESNK